MPNRHVRETNRAGQAKPPKQNGGGPGNTNMPMKTANWPGLPGKSQSRSRSGGDRKIKIHPKSEGI